MRFITTLYGDSYLGLLLTHLYSIKYSNPENRVSIYWQNCELDKIDILKTAFPSYYFIKTDFIISEDFMKRISMKTSILQRAVAEHLEEDYIGIFDTDTTVLQDIDEVFSNNFDIAFTVKNEFWPINTGVLFIKNSQRVVDFFNEWYKRTQEILLNENLFKTANSINHPYGGADQMAFHQMINYRKTSNLFYYSCGEAEVRLLSLPCKVYNETRSVPITPCLKVIHYKGGWRTILLDGYGFSRNRKFLNSLDMYLKYHEIYQKAIQFIGLSNKSVTNHIFNIYTPTFLDIPNNKVLKFKALKFLMMHQLKKINKKFYKWIK